MLEYKPYTGIGSRQTPAEILEAMEQVAYNLALKGYILRSGAAPGADSAFEDGAWSAAHSAKGASRPEIYLPWPGFENRNDRIMMRTEPQVEAYEIAEQFHPGWQYLKQGAKKLHARNVHQILGFNVLEPTPSSFVICWTPDGKGKGGTGQACRIAKDYDIEIYDLFIKENLDTVTEILK